MVDPFFFTKKRKEIGKFKGNRWIVPGDPKRKFVKTRIVQLPFVPHRLNLAESRQRSMLQEFKKLKQTSYQVRQTKNNNECSLSIVFSLCAGLPLSLFFLVLGPL